MSYHLENKNTYKYCYNSKSDDQQKNLQNMENIRIVENTIPWENKRSRITYLYVYRCSKSISNLHAQKHYQMWKLKHYTQQLLF